MRKEQVFLLVTGLLALAGMCAVPPWLAYFPELKVGRSEALAEEVKSVGYAPLWTPPAPPAYAELRPTAPVLDKLRGISSVLESKNRRLPQPSPAPATNATGYQELFDRAWEETAAARRQIDVAQSQGWLDDYMTMTKGELGDVLRGHIASRVGVDVTRLCLQCAATALVTLALIVLTGWMGIALFGRSTPGKRPSGVQNQ